MTAAKWTDQIEAIVERLPLLEKSAEKMDEREIVRKIITKNIPSSWEKDFILKEGDKAKTLEEAKKILKIVERAATKRENDEKVQSDTNVQKLPANQNPSKTKNMCRLKNHDHPWKECPNNPHSKNYNGTHFRKIRERERANDNKGNDSDSNVESRKSKRRKLKHRERTEVNSMDSGRGSNDTPYCTHVKFDDIDDMSIPSVDSSVSQGMVL